MITDWKPDFNAHHIPSRSRDASVHATLSAILARRNAIKRRREELMTDEHPDGTSKQRNEADVETVYQRLNTRYNNINRAMLTVYAQFLVVDLPGSSSIDGTALSTQPAEATPVQPPCPYSHSRDRVLTLTVPLL
jgi:hypothetical protein